MSDTEIALHDKPNTVKRIYSYQETQFLSTYKVIFSSCSISPSCYFTTCRDFFIINTLLDHTGASNHECSLVQCVSSLSGNLPLQCL